MSSHSVGLTRKKNCATIEPLAIEKTHRIITNATHKRKGEKDYGKKITVNILGTCLSRDTFSVHAEDNKFEVLQYVNEFDPFYFVEQGIEIKDKEAYDNFPAPKSISNFRRRCMYLDVTKTVMDYIKQADSDILMIDTALCRLPWSRMMGHTHITLSRDRRAFFKALREAGIVKEKITRLVENPCDELEDKLRGFVEEILKVYAPEQVIVMDNRCNYAHSNGEKLTPFGNLALMAEKDKRMGICFEALKKLIPGCHAIPMLDAAMSDTNHWLGISSLHYSKEYYDYTYECVNIIMEGLPREEEERRIQEAKAKYELIYYRKYYNMLGRTLCQSKLDFEAVVASNRRKKESLLMQTKLMSDLLLRAKNKPQPDETIRSAVIYGWTPLGELVLRVMKENGIKPVAVIENTRGGIIGKHIIEGGVPALKRGSKIPPTDCVVIADSMSVERILKKAHSTSGKKIFTAEEFIGHFKDLSQPD